MYRQGKVRVVILVKRMRVGARKVATHAEHPLHLVYFALVAVEAGHWYGVIAAGLFFVSLAHTMGGRDE